MSICGHTSPAIEVAAPAMSGVARIASPASDGGNRLSERGRRPFKKLS